MSTRFVRFYLRSLKESTIGILLTSLAGVGISLPLAAFSKPTAIAMHNVFLTNLLTQLSHPRFGLAFFFKLGLFIFIGICLLRFLKNILSRKIFIQVNVNFLANISTSFFLLGLLNGPVESYLALVFDTPTSILLNFGWFYWLAALGSLGIAIWLHQTMRQMDLEKFGY